MSISKKIQSARTALVLEQPFFGVLALRLKVIESDAFDTMATDGVMLGYNPAFVEKLNHDELKGLIAHEVMHCACGHPWREGARNHDKWNRAADYAINSVLTNAGFRLPAGGLRDPQYDGKSAEWIYDRLPEDKGGGGGNGGTGKRPPLPGETMPAPSDADQQGHGEADWQAAVAQAAKAAEMMGKLPGSLKRFAAEAVKPKVDWKSALRRFVQTSATSDYTWQLPSRRFMSMGLYLPTMRSDEIGPIMVVIDTSGSIDSVTLGQFWAEVCSIQQETRPRRVHVVYADAKVHRHDVFEKDEHMECNYVGGGGTDFRPALAEIDGIEEKPVCVVYLTDGVGTEGNQAPEMPVLWAIAGRPRSMAFGDTLEITG